MKTLLVLALGFFTPLAWAQEHAPTVAQCQADLAVWGDSNEENAYLDAENAHLDNGTPNQTSISKLSLDEVRARMHEMQVCMLVDSEQAHHYLAAGQFYSSVLLNRYANFLLRHHLMEQFKREDREGKR